MVTTDPMEREHQRASLYADLREWTRASEDAIARMVLTVYPYTREEILAWN